MEKRARGRPSGGGSKLNRTETVTIRLDPKLRYLTELAARKQRRTVSSFIEWAIERALTAVVLREDARHDGTMEVSLGEESEKLWDPDEADRVVKLGLYYPELLTYDEQVLWKLLRERGGVFVTPDNADFMGVREHWDDFKKVAAGEEDKSILPTWNVSTPSQEDNDQTPRGAKHG